MNRRSHPGRVARVVAVALALFAGAAVAQEEGGAKPEIMLLVDTSGSMQWRESFDNNAERAPICSLPGTTQPDPTLGYQQSRMNIAKEVIAGSAKRFRTSQGAWIENWCIEHTPDFRAGDDPNFPDDGHSLGADRNFPHFRPMCCDAAVGDTCTRWAPCGADHGVDGRPSDAAGPVGIETDGIIHQELERIKFGLMTFDTEPKNGADEAGHYSFGDDEDDAELRVPIGIANAVSGMSGNVARGITDINVGARNEAAPFGPLIRGSKGRLRKAGDPANADPRLLGVTEAPADVALHNHFVMDQVRAMVPYGWTPISPLLRDLVHYYEEEADTDRAFLCRKRVAVLITDGAPTQYYGGQDCANDGACGVPGARCVRGECRYPAGYPYKSPTEYAAQLYQEKNIPLFVIGFNVDGAGKDNAQAIAEVGSPGMGIEDDQPGFFLASDREQLRVALRRVSNAALQGLRTRARPLVLTPGLGDELGQRDVLQWRVATYSRIPGSADTGRYGEVEVQDFACAQVNETVQITETLRTSAARQLQLREVPRKAISHNPTTDRNFTVLSADTGAIHADGRAGTLSEGALRSLLTTPAVGPVDGDPFEVAIDTVDGYIGAESFNEDGTRRRRSMAQLLDGDVVAVQAPRLGVRSASYKVFQEAHAERPTVLVAGAADGLVHFFRADDGHEVINFLPRTSWQNVKSGAHPVDGPLAVADVAACRSLGAGRQECPAEADQLRFFTLLAGGVGDVAANIFGMDVTPLTEIADRAQDDASVDANDVWPTDDTYAGTWDVISDQQNGVPYWDPQLGRSVSRPLLTHVRTINGPDQEISAAVIVGCGDDPAPATQQTPINEDGVGRCVLVLDALTGKLIRKFANGDGVEGDDLDYPVVGSPIAWPLAGIAASDRAYIGDRHGQLWRVDLRDPDPRNWSMAKMWPAEDDELTAAYPVGKPIVDRPTIALAESGELVLVFGTGADAEDARNSVVSLSDRATLDPNTGALVYTARANWVLPLNDGERLTGAPLVREKVAFFTTAERRANDPCITAQGRLYGVHYTDVLPDNQTFKKGGRDVNVVPLLPRLNEESNRETNALSLLLPPGRLAYGLAVTLTPSCEEGGAPTTDIVLNLADESAGGKGPVQKEQTKVEVVEAGQLKTEDLDGSIFLNEGTNTLSICLDCDREGKHNAGQSLRVGPFPSVVVSWGSTFTR